MDEQKSRQERLEELRKHYPYIDDFMQCQRQAQQQAYVTFFLASGGLFAANYVMDKRKILPFPRIHMVWIPLLFGSLSAYSVSRLATRNCLERWAALEGKGVSLDSFLEGLKDYEYKEMEDCK